MINNWSIRFAADVVRSGGVIAYPTEAVWGLGCNPWDHSAVDRLLLLKRRPVSKGLILVASSVDQVARLLENLDMEQKQQVLSSWPGPNTWLIPDATNLVPQWIKGDFSSVAVRVTDHPLVKVLCDRVGMPIVSTSANPSGCKPALTKLQVSNYFGSNIDFSISGSLGKSAKPSVIRDAITGTIIRQ